LPLPETRPGEKVDSLMKLIQCGYFRLLVDDTKGGPLIVGHQFTMPSGEVVEEVLYQTTH
jgi:hypothetical protein